MNTLVGAGLTALAIVCFLGSPTVLSRGLWRFRHPRMCLILWQVAVVTGGALLTVGAGYSVSAGAIALQGTPFDGWVGTTVEVLTGWVALALAGPAVGIVATQITVLVRAEAQQRALFERLVACPGCRDERISDTAVCIVPSTELVALGLRRRGTRLLISTAVVEALEPDELLALVAHEQAHLREFHDVALRLATLSLGCLPDLGPARQLSRSTALLIELAADRAAAARTSPTCAAAALRKIAELTTSAGTAQNLRLRAALLT